MQLRQCPIVVVVLSKQGKQWAENKTPLLFFLSAEYQNYFKTQFSAAKNTPIDW